MTKKAFVALLVLAGLCLGTGLGCGDEKKASPKPNVEGQAKERPAPGAPADAAAPGKATKSSSAGPASQ